jgi:hypothetical protein
MERESPTSHAFRSWIVYDQCGGDCGYCAFTAAASVWSSAVARGGATPGASRPYTRR